MRVPCHRAINDLRPHNLSRGFIWIAVVIAACLWPISTFGQTNSKWNGGTGNWSAGSDWTPNGAPNNGGANTYSVTIDSGGTDTVTLDQNATINSLVLGGASGSSSLQNLSGTAETLNITGGLTVSHTGALTFSNGSSLGVGGNTTIVGSLDLDQASNLGISGNLLNSGTMTMNGLGDGGGNTVTVSGTFTNKGTLDLGANPGSGNSFSANSIVNYGSIANSATAASSLSAGTMINNGSIQSLNFLDVGTMTNNGGITLGHDDTSSAFADFGTLINNVGGGIEIGNASSQSVSIGTLTNKGGIDVENNESGAPALQVSGNIVNSGSITASEAGHIQLGGNMSLNNKGLIDGEGGIIEISENSVVNTGTLEGVTLGGNKLTNTNGMIIGGTISENTTSNTGTLEGVTFEGGVLTNANGIVSGGILESGKVTNTNGVIMGGTLLEGGVVVTGGTLSGVETPSGETATLNGVTNLGSYVMADNSTTILSGKITNNGSISLSSIGNQTIAMILSGGATLAGSGTLTLGTGGPNIIEGSTGKEFLTNSSTIQGAGTIKNVGLINNGTILANAGTLAIAPTVQLYGFTNNGNLIVDSGSAVNITGPVKLSFQTTGTVTVSSGATLSVGGSSAFTQTKGTTTVDGNLSAANGIFISGGLLDGNGGTLTGNLSLAGASLNPGDGANKIGKLTVSGAHSQTSTSFLDIDLDGTKSGTFDVLNINGSASLHGTLNVDALTGFTPKVGETFDILIYSSETGTFSTVDCAFSNGDGCSVTYNGTDAVLTITAPAAPAARGTVSGAPATRVSRNMGASAAEPVTILSRATCFATRLLGSESCGVGSVATVADGGEIRAVSVGSREVHNNIMVATRSVAVARGGASHENIRIRFSDGQALRLRVHAF